MKEKIGIFTCLSMIPPHPRIEMEFDLLVQNGYQVEIIFSRNKKNSEGIIKTILYYITFTYFRWDLIYRYRNRVDEFDIVIAYDMALLPLLKYAKKKGKKTIYEVIDNNVHLIAYHLLKQLKILFFIKPFLILIFTKLEKILSKHADTIIVNSIPLAENYPPQKTRINYYASPFENTAFTLGNATRCAFLYLGIFSLEKGAFKMLELAEKYNLPLIIFGEIRGDIHFNPAVKIIHQNRSPITEISTKIIEISAQHRLIGLSLIQSINKSYATQEANKDIDYLAFGIPLIGNYRITTKEKIDAGCGVLYEDDNKIKLLINDEMFYRSLSKNAKEYYQKKYSVKKFEQLLIRAVG